MKTNQPAWKCVAQLGDVNPLDYGGLWVLIDTTGVYSPEGELYDVNTQRVYRFILEDCTFTHGVLSDNKYHPDQPAWFADALRDVADFIGAETRTLIDMFISADPVERARAWQAVGDYFGWDNLDCYPLLLTRSEAKRRYTKAMYRERERAK